MEVVLCEETKLTFEDVQSAQPLWLFDNSIVSSDTRKVVIPPIEVDQKLLDDLESHRVTTTLEVGDTITGFELLIGGPDKKKNGVGPGYIKLEGVDTFLYGALGGHPKWMNQLELQLTLAPIIYSNGYCKLEPAETSYSFKTRQPTMLFHGSSRDRDVADIWNNLWPRPQNSWSTVVSVKIKLPPLIKQKRALVNTLSSANGRLLKDEVLADSTVIAANKAEIKFHRCFLAVQSPVFEEMFQADMKEARTGILELPDMSEEGVRALKVFLYVGCLPTEFNLSVCLELFKAGHKYAINELVAAMEEIFLEMDVEWCSADVALGLFLFVKDLEFPQLKYRAVQLLKLKCGELKQLPRYRDLFKEENANVAMELMECFGQDLK